MNPDYQNVTEKEYKEVQRNFRVLGLAVLGLLFIGASFYHFVEKLSWVDAIYFSTITLTTVGYGDIVPKTDAEKIFTIFYVICGIGILATFANTLVRNAVVRRSYLKSKNGKSKK